MSITRDSNESTRFKMASREFLQSLVEQFNTQSKSSLLPTKKSSELKEHKHYIVHDMRKIETSLGEAILVSLSDAPYVVGNEAKFQMFLPKRFVHQLQNEDLNIIEPGSLYLVSHGVSGNKSTELSLHVSPAQSTNART
jgi:hypothetical protein